MIEKVHAIHAIDISNLVKKAEYDAKIKDIEYEIPNCSVYITTNGFNKFWDPIFDKGLT